MRFWPIYQQGQYSASAHPDLAATYFTEEKGKSDAENAIAAAKALGIPSGTIIYFAVDFDAMDHNITNNVIPYFRKVNEVMSSSIYKTGIYGARNVCSRVSASGYSSSSFVANMSTGWSGNLGFKMPNDWAFDQFADRYENGNFITIASPDGAFEIDKNGFSGRDRGVGRLDDVVANPPTIKLEAEDVNLGSAESDKLRGSTVNILGFEVPLFTLDLDLDLKVGKMESHYDNENNTLEVLMGVKVFGEETEITGEREKAGKYKEAYRNVKTMVSSIGKNQQEFSKKFKDFKGSLYDRGTKVGFDFNSYVFLYTTINCTTGNIIEGGLGFVGEAKTSISYPMVPCVYAKFQIEGSIGGGLQLRLNYGGSNEITNVDAKGNLGFSVKPSFGVELDVLVASAYAGISGELNCELRFPVESFAKSFEASINASVFFEYSALFWGDRWDWVFTEHQLYPSESPASTLSINTNNMDFIPPIPQTMSALAANDPNIFKEGMQIYTKPQIVSLGNGNMFMVYIDDRDVSANPDDKNRSILMYSVYDGYVWSIPQPVLNDNTADFEPVLSSDGNGGVHILWQNANSIFNNNVTLEEMSTNMDLNYIHWNGFSFNSLSAITSNNQNLEMSPRITSSGNNISVVWEQNSENDPLALTGTNSILRKQFSSGTWQSTEILASGLAIITSIDTTYIGSNNVVAYTVKSGSDTATTNDLEVYYVNGSQTTRLTNDETPDYSVSFLNNELYWVSGNSIVSISNGNLNTKETLVENLNAAASEIKSIVNPNDSKSIVWEQEDDSGMTFYGINYNTTTGSWETVKPLATNSGVIRGWDACLQPNGQIELAYCYADYLNTPVNGLPYDTLALIQKPVNKFYNIIVDPVVVYDGDVFAGKEITLFANIYNSGSHPVSQFDVKIIGANNSVMQTLAIEQSLAVGESAELSIPLTLPSSIMRSDYRIEILPSGGTDVSTSDNEAIFSFGFADLAIENIQEVRIGSDRQLKVTVANKGFDTISSATLTFFAENSDGELFGAEEINLLTPGDSVEFTFDIDGSYSDSSISENPHIIYTLLETPDLEYDYGNNMQEVYIYPDYTINITGTTGGTVGGSGTFENDALALITASPSSGYLFDGWYEDGKIVCELSQYHIITVNANRTLEARFKPNDLIISDVEVFGALQKGQSLTFTAFTEGGASPLYKWSFYILGGSKVYYSGANSDADFFEWTPMASGTYTVAAYAQDESGFRVSMPTT